MAWKHKPKPITLSSLVAAQNRSKPKKSFVRSVNGVARIQSDSYGSDWYSTADAVRERDGNRCAECGSTKHLHVHHIRRLSRNGTTTKVNLITLCDDCHSKRHPHMHK